MILVRPGLGIELVLPGETFQFPSLRPPWEPLQVNIWLDEAHIPSEEEQTRHLEKFSGKSLQGSTTVGR